MLSMALIEQKEAAGGTVGTATEPYASAYRFWSEAFQVDLVRRQDGVWQVILTKTDR